MSELTTALDAYAARVATLPGVDVVDRLLPGATDEQLAAAEAWVGAPLPAELVEWFRWHNGVRGNGFWSRMLLPLGGQVASGGWGEPLDSHMDNVRQGNSGVPGSHLKLMPDKPFPILMGDRMLGWIECNADAAIDGLWLQTFDSGWVIVRYGSLVEYVERAIVFFDRAWVVPNGLGGVWVAPSLDGRCPTEMRAWAAREGVAGVESWWPQANFFMVDPLSPSSPEPILETWW